MPPSLTLHLSRSVTTAVNPSPRVLEVAGMFGLGVDESRTLAVVPPIDLALRGGEIVFITGPSGGGKSTLLRLIAAALQSDASFDGNAFVDGKAQGLLSLGLPGATPCASPTPATGVAGLCHATGAAPPATRCVAAPPCVAARLIRFDDLPPLPDAPLVDCFPEAPLPRLTAALARAGLADAFVMLRSPRELSDGQRYRLRLAQAMLEAEPSPSDVPIAPGRGWPVPGPGEGTAESERAWERVDSIDPSTPEVPSPQPSPGRGAPRGYAAGRGGGLCVLLADEFGATLDRLTAAVIARNVRRWVSQSSHVCFIAATTHDDLLEHLQPDVLIEKSLGGRIEMVRRI